MEEPGIKQGCQIVNIKMFILEEFNKYLKTILSKTLATMLRSEIGQ